MLNGILLIDKPKGLSSYKTVEKITRKFRIKKAGHLGTLDPMATGLLPICINEATKAVQFLIDKDKEYEGTLLLGKVTDTGDLEGKVLKEDKKVKVSEAQIKSAFKKFTGTYLQTPPMHSAIKQNGKRLYKIARRGKEVERKKRKVSIYSLTPLEISRPGATVKSLMGVDLPCVKFRVTCSKGTYIRNLVKDIGEELGCGATLAGLRRTKAGDFSIKKAKKLDVILDKKNIENYLIDIKTGLGKMPNIKVKNSFLKVASCGTPVYKEAISSRNFKLNKGLIVKVLSQNGELISVARCIRDEKDLAKLAANGIVFNHIRVFKPSDEARSPLFSSENKTGGLGG